MNKDQFKGQWNQFKGKVKEKWGKLTDNDLTQISGKRDVLLGKLQSVYGLAKEKAEQQLTDFENSLGDFELEEEDIETTSDYESTPTAKYKGKKPY